MVPCYSLEMEKLNNISSYFVANFLRSAFNCPGKRRQVVTPFMSCNLKDGKNIPDMVMLTKWLRSPYVGVVSFKVLKHIS